MMSPDGESSQNRGQIAGLSATPLWGRLCFLHHGHEHDSREPPSTNIIETETRLCGSLDFEFVVEEEALQVEGGAYLLL